MQGSFKAATRMLLVKNVGLTEARWIPFEFGWILSLIHTDQSAGQVMNIALRKNIMPVKLWTISVFTVRCTKIATVSVSLDFIVHDVLWCHLTAYTTKHLMRWVPGSLWWYYTSDETRKIVTRTVWRWGMDGIYRSGGRSVTYGRRLSRQNFLWIGQSRCWQCEPQYLEEKKIIRNCNKLWVAVFSIKKTS